MNHNNFYKKGDKVIIKDLQTLRREYGIDGFSFINTPFPIDYDSQKLCGKIVTIRHVHEDGFYYIGEDDGYTHWCDEAFDGIVYVSENVDILLCEV